MRNPTVHLVTPHEVDKYAARLIRSRARSFYVASLFLPARLRKDAQIVYAYFRTVDDLVDEPPEDWSRCDVLEALNEWDEGISGRGPIPGALCEAVLRVVERHAIPISYLRMVIDGARFDLDMRFIETRAQLIAYSDQVAGSVGMVMAHVLGATHVDAISAARSLGIAMQLTNVLRDVGEDLDRGRVYLPLEELARHGCGPNQLHSRAVTPEMRTVMAELAGEARSLYRQGIRGIPYLDSSAQFAIYLAATLYGHILDKLALQDFEVFTCRAHLTTFEKWMLAVPTYMHHKRMAQL